MELSMADSSFLQDPQYTAAIKELRREFVTELLDTARKDTTSGILQNFLTKRTSPDFNSFRNAAKSLSNSQSSSAGSDARSSSSTSLLRSFTQDDYFADPRDSRRYDLINKIEAVMSGVLKDISNGNHPKLILRNQKLWSNCMFEERELYYQNVDRVKNQSAIDSAIRDLCCLLQTPPWDLGLLATSKGLLAGPVSFKTSCGHSVSCMGAGGVLIPQDVNNITSIESNAKFILVVEKDAIFQKLLDEGALERLGPCIIMTGKGYPDVNTRLMLKLLVETLKIRSLALVDADPHGIEIMCTYRFGSLAMSHLSDRLAVPSLRWLGVHASDISRLGAPSLALSARDVAKVGDILARPYCATSAALRHELQLLLENRHKTEIEGIGTMSQAYLTDGYIPHKICAKDFI